MVGRNQRDLSHRKPRRERGERDHDVDPEVVGERVEIEAFEQRSVQEHVTRDRLTDARAVCGEHQWAREIVRGVALAVGPRPQGEDERVTTVLADSHGTREVPRVVPSQIAVDEEQEIVAIVERALHQQLDVCALPHDPRRRLEHQLGDLTRSAGKANQGLVATRLVRESKTAAVPGTEKLYSSFDAIGEPDNVFRLIPDRNTDQQTNHLPPRSLHDRSPRTHDNGFRGGGSLRADYRRSQNAPTRCTKAKRERETRARGIAVQLRVVRPSELGGAELDTWRALQRDDAALASPFLAPEFALAVDDARNDARVGVVEDAGQLVAFLAFSTTEDRNGAPIGATICDAQALVARAGFDWDPPALVHAAGLEVWDFDHLVATQKPFQPFHHTLHRSPIIDLSEGHDAYLEHVRARSKDVLPQVARRRRKLAREVGEVTLEWQTTDPDVLATLFTWKSAQYRETGVWDRFDQPWIVDVVQTLASTTTHALTGMLTTLRAGEHLVAVHFGLRGRDHLVWWFPAYDLNFANYSPGLILLVDLVAEATARGLQRIDLGRGEHHYKLRVATGAYDVAEGAVPATR